MAFPTPPAKPELSIAGPGVGGVKRRIGVSVVDAVQSEPA